MAKANHEFVLRPFEGLPGEADWVALREVVPAATATARTTAEHGACDVLVVTTLPAGWRALHRTDGAVLLSLQGLAGSGDVSRDYAADLLTALAAEPGTSVPGGALPGPGPRLQDVLDPSVPFEVTVHDDFSFWFAPDQKLDAEAKAALEQASEDLVPTVKLTGVDSAYVSTFGPKRFLRWSMAVDEDRLINALARLQARREAGIGDSRFLGAFRSCGIVVPVWDLVPAAGLDDIEAGAVELSARLEPAVASDEPLTYDERRARAGIISRQVTLR
ncbi:MAG: DUF5926 family protein [Cellulomonadaceae bacterium]